MSRKFTLPSYQSRVPVILFKGSWNLDPFTPSNGFLCKNAKKSMHCNENPTYVLLLWEYSGLSPNFHIHVSVSDLYSPRIGLHISSSRIGRPIVGSYKSHITHECGNWDWVPDIPFMGIFVSKFRYFVFAVWIYSSAEVNFDLRKSFWSCYVQNRSPEHKNEN